MVIDQALRAGRLPNAATLSRQLGASRRTIARDIELMKYDLLAPIEFDPFRNGFLYTDLTYRLPYFQMSEGELLGLYLAERMMQQLRGTPIEADLRRAIAKLNTMLPNGVSVRLDDIADMLTVLPATQSYYNPECSRALTSTVVCRRPVDIVYGSASAKSGLSRFFFLSLAQNWPSTSSPRPELAVRVLPLQAAESPRARCRGLPIARRAV
jgi:predicted DNA-binding transcriptional regulator YafY